MSSAFYEYLKERDEDLCNELFDWLKKKSNNAMLAPMDQQPITAEQRTSTRRSATLAPMAQQPSSAGQRVSQRKSATLAPMSQQPPTAGQRGPKTVPFKMADLVNLKNSIQDYQGLVSKFLTSIQEHLATKMSQYKRLPKLIAGSFEQMVGRPYQQLHLVPGWIDQMRIRLNQKKQRNESILIEAVSVNYQHFKQITQTILTMTKAMDRWVRMLSEKLGGTVQSLYDAELSSKQSILMQQAAWLDDKVSELMQANRV